MLFIPQLQELNDAMKKIISPLIAVALLLPLMGCANVPKTPEIVIKKEIQYIRIPDIFLKKCPIEKPPTENKYLEADFNEREEILINYSQKILKNLIACNLQIEELYEWNESQINQEGENKPGIVAND